MPTLKLLATSITFALHRMQVQALVTGLASIPGIDQNHLDTRPQGFVVDEQPQLMECPTVAAPPFSFGARLLISTFPNPGQVLQGDTGLIGFGSGN